MSRLLQVIIAIAGLAITIMLHLAAERNQEAQARQTYVAQFTQTLAHAIATCNPTMISLAIEAATEIDEINGDSTYANRVAEVQGTCGNAVVAQQMAEGAPMTEQVEAEPPSSAPSTGSSSPPPAVTRPTARDVASNEGATLALPPQQQLEVATRNLELQREEIVPRRARSAESGGYYAVLASYSTRDPVTFNEGRGAPAHYNALVQATSNDGVTVRVYRTNVSNHYAIVLVPDPATEEAARELMTRARREGWSTDAFVQQDRGWVACENPSTVEGLRACGGTARR